MCEWRQSTGSAAQTTQKSSTSTSKRPVSAIWPRRPSKITFVTRPFFCSGCDRLRQSAIPPDWNKEEGAGLRSQERQKRIPPATPGYTLFPILRKSQSVNFANILQISGLCAHWADCWSSNICFLWGSQVIMDQGKQSNSNLYNYKREISAAFVFEKM